MNKKVKALLDAIAEWEKVDDLVKQYGWGKWVDDDNNNAVLLDEWWDGARNNMLMLAKEVNGIGRYEYKVKYKITPADENELLSDVSADSHEHALMVARFYYSEFHILGIVRRSVGEWEEVCDEVK